MASPSYTTKTQLVARLPQLRFSGQRLQSHRQFFPAEPEVPRGTKVIDCFSNGYMDKKTLTESRFDVYRKEVA